jgi:hypothetical protein
LRSIVKKPDLEGFDSVRIYEEHTKEGVFGKTVVSTAIPRQECPKLKDTLVIAYDGSVSRCNHIWMTIRDVWNSEVLQNIRESYPDEKCETCDQWTGHTCGESWKFKSGKVEHTKYGPAGVVNG